VKDRIYLVLNKNKVERMTRTTPPLKANEIYIVLTVSVPKQIFQRPTFQGDIAVTDNGTGFELVIKELEQGIAKLKGGS